MRIYLSGPITGHRSARRDFASVERRLRWAGEQDIVNPEAVLRSLRMDHNEYMHICKALLEVSDVILLLPGWRRSTGACMEVGFALSKQMKIFELDADFSGVHELKF